MRPLQPPLGVRSLGRCLAPAAGNLSQMRARQPLGEGAFIEPAGKSTELAFETAFETAFVSALSPDWHHKLSKYSQNHVDS